MNRFRTSAPARPIAPWIAAALLACAPAACRADGPERPFAQESPPGSRTTNDPDAVHLDLAIENVLQNPDYAWRMPRTKPTPEERDESLLWNFIRAAADRIEHFFKTMGRAIRRFMDWLDSLLPARSPSPSGTDLEWQDSVRGLLFVLLAIVASILAVTLWRLWRQRLKPARGTA